MATITRTEKRQRGFFGWVFLITFWVFQLLMVLWFVGGMSAATDTAASLTSEAERAGAAIGTVIGASMILAIWAFGTLILGVFALLTRGKKIIVETS
jgi:hypothetical protein